LKRFGTNEVIRPLSLNRIVARKEAYFGELGSVVEKVADSSKPELEQDALATLIRALKHIYAGNSDYCCIELFTEPKKPGVSTVNVCHMKRTK
jgi:hypothetical protein